MKIFLHAKNQSGGAPRSLLAYATVLNSFGWQLIINVQVADGERNIFKEAGFKTVNLMPVPSLKEPIKFLRTAFKYSDFLKKGDFNLLHTNRPFECIFLRFVSLLTGIPAIFAQAGGVVSEIIPEVMSGTRYIVYSKENEDFFLRKGFAKNELFLIPNRMIFDDCRVQGRSCDGLLLKCVAIGNIKKETVNSHYFVLALIERLLDAGINATLDILGDFLPSSQCLRKGFLSEVDMINRRRENTIRMHGFVEQTKTFIKRADVCFGKGRSILEAAAIPRLSFVVNERREMALICNDNFQTLLDGNFAGRNITASMVCDFNSFLTISTNIIEQGMNVAEFEGIASKIRKAYSVFEASKVIFGIFSGMVAGKKPKKGLWYAIFFLLKLYALCCKRYIKKLRFRLGNGEIVNDSSQNYESC